MRMYLSILVLAAVLTGLNAIKPLHVDGATFYFNAAQIAAHPFDPYGYAMLRWSDAIPALHALAPPGLSYWWAAAIRMFGEQPILWKWNLFPVVLLFVSSLAALLRRFVPSVATPLLVLLVLSPVFLPSLNLMMDIPALALSLTALVLFFRACDNDSPTLAILAGLTAGSAMQTKYTAFLVPAIVFVYARLQQKMRLGLSVIFLAGMIFAAWETVLLFRYGESHFLYQLFQGDNGDQPKIMLLGCLFPLLGGAAPTLALLALTVLPAPRWLWLVAAVFLVLPFLLLVCPEALSLGGRLYVLADVLFACNGGVILLCLGWAVRCLLAASNQGASPMKRPQLVARFLALWLALELAGYIAISPFPAVRRIMGTTIAATLLIGCLAEQFPLGVRQRNVLRGLVLITVLLGLGFFVVDYLEARAEQQAAYDAVEHIRQKEPQARLWYAGYWGFQFYAQECGMRQIVPLRNPHREAPSLLPPSHFRRGDWLVIPDESIPQQELDLNRPELELKEQIAIGDAVPLSTLMNYYAGAVPLRRRRCPRIVVRLFRVKDDFVAR